MNRSACAFLVVTLLTITSFSQTTRRRARPRPQPAARACPAPLDAANARTVARTIGFMLQEGNEARSSGDMEKAFMLTHQALMFAQRHCLADAEATAHTNLAVMWSDVGEYRKSHDSARQALIVSRAANLPEREARALNQLGWLAKRGGDPTQGLTYYRDALAIQRRLGADGEADTLNSMGLLFDKLGDADQALAHYRQALTATERMRHVTSSKQMRAAILGNIGSLHQAQGDRRRAADCYRRVLIITREIGDVRSEATALNNLGSIYFQANDFDRAIAHYEQALTIYNRTSNHEGQVVVLKNLADFCHRTTGETECALELLRTAIVVCEKMKDAQCSAGVRRDIDALRKPAAMP